MIYYHATQTGEIFQILQLFFIYHNLIGNGYLVILITLVCVAYPEQYAGYVKPGLLL
jgi:hypothetical protein